MAWPGFFARRCLWENIDRDGLPGLNKLQEATVECLRGGGCIFFAGNGGSAADAQHLAAEYVGAELSAIALTTDTSVLTALANDLGYDGVFAVQLKALAQRGDLLVVHSTSGNSLNVIEAVRQAKEIGIPTVGLSARGGGRLAEEVDVSIVVPVKSTALAQEVHLAIGHIVFAYALEAVE